MTIFLVKKVLYLLNQHSSTCCARLCAGLFQFKSAAGGLSYKEKECALAFSRLARSLATVYIFARVRIFGTSVPFSDPISDISHTFSVLFPAILYIFRPALNLSPLNHQHAIQRIFEIFEIERDFKPSDSST